MRSIPTLILAATSAVLILGSPAASAEASDLALVGGIPARFSGDVTLETDSGTILLDHVPQTWALTHQGSTVRVVTLTEHFTILPDGSLLRVHQSASEAVTDLAPGELTLALGPSAPLIAAQVTDASITSAAEPVNPAATWDEANAQVSGLIQPRDLFPTGPASIDGPALPAADVAPGLVIAAGAVEGRALQAAAAAATDRVHVFDGTLTQDAASFTAATDTQRLPGGVFAPSPLASAPTWTGPGEHVECRLTYVDVVPTNGELDIAAAEAPITLYAESLLVRLDGTAALPWARGRIDQSTATHRIDGQQLLFGGRLDLRTLDVDLERSPAIHWLATGDLSFVQVGPLAAGPTPGEAAMVATSAGAAAIGLAALLYYAPSLKYGATLALFPLYARVPRENVLDHPGRETVYERIRQEPGISTHRLSDSVDFGWSTLAYHLRVLERNQLVTSIRDGRYKRFFDRESGRYANARKYTLSTLRNETTLALGRAVLAAPGITQKELSDQFGLSPSSIHWHVVRLERAGLLEKARDGHNVRYRPGPSWSDVRPEDIGMGAPLPTTPVIAIETPSAPAVQPVP